MLALFRPGRLFPGDFGPKRIGLLTVRLFQLSRVGGQPFRLAGERTAPALFLRLLEGAHRLGGGQHPLGQIVDGRVEHARIGLEEGRAVAPLDLPTQHLPGLGGEETARCLAEEGFHRGG